MIDKPRLMPSRRPIWPTYERAKARRLREQRITAVFGGPSSARIGKPRSRAFVQSGFYEVVIEPAIRATLCHATSQNPPDSSRVPVGFNSCALGGGSPTLQQNL